MNGTLAFLFHRFWWPTTDKDVRDFVAACSTCVQKKTFTKPTSRLLCLLTVPNCPWSHITLHFVTNLPSSNGNTVILTIIDRFSKLAHFIPLPKPLFCSYCIPDIVSDRGSQFISQVWKSFCIVLGCTVSLSSGFQPQTNGQTERVNEELEAALCCVVSANPSHWSPQLSWVEYGHNSLTNAYTRISI